jgi:lipopolysaccharide biosynthesis regulator YciM
LTSCATQNWPKSAKRNLLEIYQLEKDWEKAIAIASELPDFASHKEIAEYYCELAAAEMIRSRRDLAAATCRPRSSATASAFAPACSRGHPVPAGSAARRDRIVAAHRTAGSAYLALVAQRLLDAFRKLDRREEGLQLLRGYLEHYPSLDLLDVVFQLVLEAMGRKRRTNWFAMS